MMDAMPEKPKVFDGSINQLVGLARSLPDKDRDVIVGFIASAIVAIRSATTDLDKMVFYTNPVLEKLRDAVVEISRE